MQQVHRCTQGGGGAGRWGIRKGPPFQIFKNLVNKNAMTPKVWDPSGKLGIFAKIWGTPSPGLSIVCIYALVLRALLLA